MSESGVIFAAGNCYFVSFRYPSFPVLSSSLWLRPPYTATCRGTSGDGLEVDGSWRFSLQACIAAGFAVHGAPISSSCGASLTKLANVLNADCLRTRWTNEVIDRRTNGWMYYGQQAINSVILVRELSAWPGLSAHCQPF
jgi:hypothetical protein